MDEVLEEEDAVKATPAGPEETTSSDDDAAMSPKNPVFLCAIFQFFGKILVFDWFEHE